uniref:Uncharacterized protein n=1 Tax=Anguilla anguilla TaxID=7936 RepID=A0A0E9XXM1_ANGAN
MPLIRQSS